MLKMNETLKMSNETNVTTLSTNNTLIMSTNSSASNGSDYMFCGPDLIAFRNAYSNIHGYLSLLVCLFGSVANSLNIAILTRREMRSPTNVILTGLAVADLMVMLEYIPYATHMHLTPDRPRLSRYSYGWSMFVLFHSIFAQVCHTVSIWLTVTLAVWRYIAVAYPQKNREWCRMETTVIAIISAYIVCPLICIPLYLTFSLSPRVETFTGGGYKFNSSTYNATIDGPTFNATIYILTFSDMAETSILKDLDFWVYSVVIKIIPCIALTVLSTRLIFALIETKKRRQNLSTVAVPLTSVNENGDCKSTKKQKKSVKLLDKEKQTDRTTRMLLAVLLLFLITEFPQGILGLLSVVLEEKFFAECYVNLGDIMDILALLNSAINFILYCAMSRQFRTTFSTVFGIPRFAQRWLPVSLHPESVPCDGNGHTTAVTQILCFKFTRKLYNKNSPEYHL